VVNELDKSSVIFIMGATATGKTDLAIEIAQRFPVELISVDSALIYRNMNIGTAKPSAEVLLANPHFLVDIIDPAQHYSAWDFVSDTKKLIEQIVNRGNLPLFVGGTMMYFHALEQGLNQMPMADQSLRNQINNEAEVLGWPAMHQKLKAIDSVSAEKIKRNDSQRIQRALEVFQISGQTLSSLQAIKSINNNIDPTKFILNVQDRQELHKRIEQRFHLMLQNGLIEEVEALKSRPDLHLNMPSMRCVGYRQVWQYLEGQLKYDEMIFKSIVATRQLAKRQMTWLRKQPQKNNYDCLNLQHNKIKDAIYTRLGSLFI
jgi:tRNA dimethylallyltransferase|tara:strand:- start:6841 stop:7791 length:951 start_codon:yes stop_codon:yes gene_type:complete